METVHYLSNLVIELGILIFAARIGGMAAEKVKLPGIVGELCIGILIGPYLLGGIAFPGFPHGILGSALSGGMPVSRELNGIAAIASIILLFGAGIETDFKMLMRYSVAGICIGIGGVIFSFIIGAGTAYVVLNIPFTDPAALFLGSVCTATSVGISARILSYHKKTDSPEGVSILAGAVFDDIIGVIILAVVVGMAAQKKSAVEFDSGTIGKIALKAVGVWAVCTGLGVGFAKKISAFLKKFKSITTMSILSLALAFILAGFFEKSGLAMIIGAYVMGLSLSRTDLTFVIHEKLHTLQSFFVPVFFTIMGMQVNLLELTDLGIIKFGLIFTAGAVFSKIAGCVIPARFLGFNLIGALRIGVGMVPRGEVALIITGIGFANGILDSRMFGAAVCMTFLSSVLPPPLLDRLLKNPAKGTIKELNKEDKTILTYPFPSRVIMEMFNKKLIESFSSEGFYINMTRIKGTDHHEVYHLNKERSAFTLTAGDNTVMCECAAVDSVLVKNVVYETLLYFTDGLKEMKDIMKPDEFRKEITAYTKKNDNTIFRKNIDRKAVLTDLRSRTKEDAIRELCRLLFLRDLIENEEEVFAAVMEREKIMSTGLEKGIAVPHARCRGIKNIRIALGVQKEGIDFQAIDGMLSQIICLIISPKDNSSGHLQTMSAISSFLCSDQNREKVLASRTADELFSYIAGK